MAIIGSTRYLLMLWILGAVFLTALALVLRSQTRIRGKVSWILFPVLGPLPAFGAIPLANLVGLSDRTMLPLLAIAVAASIPWLYWVLPAMLPDFQVSSFPATLGYAMLIGLALGISGFLDGQIVEVGAFDLSLPQTPFPEAVPDPTDSIQKR